MTNTQRIAVFDDHPINRERLSDTIRVMGMEPLRVDDPPPLAQIGEYLRNKGINGVVTDHRLNERPYSDYLGAELVHACYGAKIGAVLMTSWTQQDADTTLRIHRRWLPCVIDLEKSGDIPSYEILAALKQADGEARQGILAPNREPFRTIMTVTSIENKAKGEMANVLIGQWDPNEEVAFPANMIPEEIRLKLDVGELLIAKVNLDAERPEDLYFENFELPEADAYRESQAFFDHP